MSDILSDEPISQHWSTGVDVDLDVALALSRAAVETLLLLSPDAADHLRGRLREAIREIEGRGTARGVATGAMLRRFVDDGT